MPSILDFLSEEELHILNLGLSVFCFVVAALILISMAVEPYKHITKTNKGFLFMISFLIATYASDAAMRILYGRRDILGIFGFVAILSYFIAGLFGYFGCNYILLLIEETTEINPVLKKITQVFFMLSALIYIIPFVGRHIITVLPDASVTRGDWYTIRILISAVMILLIYIILWDKRKDLDRKDLYIFAFYFTLPILSTIQSFWTEIPTLFSELIMTCLIYIDIYHRRSKEALEREKNFTEQQKQLTDAKVRMMQSQIRPHFLFNTLNSIASLCYIDEKLAKKTTEDFSKYIESNMSTPDTADTISFRKEIEHVKLYTGIEKLRYEDNLKVIYDLQSLYFLIPPLTVQPLVENAIKHGVRCREGKGTVAIRSFENEDSFIVRVEDDGVGFDTAALYSDENTHMGLDLTRERISLICRGTLDIVSTPGVGTTISIIIPKK